MSTTHSCRSRSPARAVLSSSLDTGAEVSSVRSLSQELDHAAEGEAMPGPPGRWGAIETRNITTLACGAQSLSLNCSDPRALAFSRRTWAKCVTNPHVSQHSSSVAYHKQPRQSIQSPDIWIHGKVPIFLLLKRSHQCLASSQRCYNSFLSPLLYSSR